jgi:hypothetical protein
MRDVFKMRDVREGSRSERKRLGIDDASDDETRRKVEAVAL